MEANTPIRQIKGIGDKLEKLFHHLGIYTAQDIADHFPFKYADIGKVFSVVNATFMSEASICGVVAKQPQLHKKGKLSVLTFQVEDSTGQMDVVYFNQPYLAKQIHAGREYTFYGKIYSYQGRAKLQNPMIIKPGMEGILSFYPTTSGLGQTVWRKTVAAVLDEIQWQEPFSPAFLQYCGLKPLDWAYENIHRPKDVKQAKLARDQLAFRELMYFAYFVLELEQKEKSFPAQALPVEQGEIEAFERRYPFALTGAQKRVIHEIAEDLKGTTAMNRLIQGDVGCGKTLIAQFGMACALKNHAQCMLMAPTEVLAQQHFEEAKKVFPEAAIRLVKGSLSSREKSDLETDCLLDRIDIIIGTHALLYNYLPLKNLAVVVLDEQHKFGVAQRARLIAGEKGIHSITMSATPIPRSLALALYGKTQISILDEMPASRKPIKTHLVPSYKRKDLYQYVKEQAQKGERIYMVCPFIEENSEMDVKSVEEVYDAMCQLAGKDQVGMLHGKMDPMVKEWVIDKFKEGSTPILVSTTVIEVGINVPEATIMVIENAERFGLAQLHQIRGRVGRGERQSQCYAVVDNMSSLDRLKIFKDHQNGFEIAELDLKIRGQGQIYGTLQHGKDQLKIADLIYDIELFLKAKKLLEELRQSSEYAQDFQTIGAQSRQMFWQQRHEVVMN